MLAPAAHPARRSLASLAPAAVLASAAVLAGCGARSSVDDDPSVSGPDVPRVADCARRTPEATPLAQLHQGGDPFGIGSDAGYLYFISEARVWRIAKAGGAAVPLTPPGSAGGSLQITADSLLWAHDHTVFRVPLAGGEPAVVGSAPGPWRVGGKDLIADTSGDAPGAVTRTPLGGGASEQILPAVPKDSGNVEIMGSLGDGVLVQRPNELYLVPPGEPPLLLASVSAQTGARPLGVGGVAYFGARGSGFAPVLERTAAAGGGTPVVLMEGFAVATAIAGDTLYANIVARKIGDGHTGVLVRLPAAGGEAVVMTTTDAAGQGKGDPPSIYSFQTSGLAADSHHVYFVEVCTDSSAAEYRLVSLPASYAE